jgi:hypothetical protein
MMEIRKDGITTVAIKSQQDMANTAIGIVKVMENIPELAQLVAGLMAKAITLEDLGIESVATRQVGSQESFDDALTRIQGEQPAEDKDIPDFVKRSMKGKEDE